MFKSISSINTLCNSLKVINKSSELKRYRLVLFVQTMFLILSRRTFDTGWSGSMEMDEIPQRQSGLHRQHSPHQERLFLSVRRVDRRSCPKPHQKQTLNIIWRQMGHPAFFKIIYCMLKNCVKSTDESHK